MSKSNLNVTERAGLYIVDFGSQPVLDEPACRAVAADLFELAERSGHTGILLDLSAVRFLASSMIGTMVSLHRKASDRGAMVVLCGLADNLRKAFQASRLDTILHFAPSVDAGARFCDPLAEAPDGAGSPEPVPPGRWAEIVSRQIRILFAGAMILVPLAITVWIVYSLGTWIDGLGQKLFGALGVPNFKLPGGIGALIILVVINVAGLLTHLWLFRGAFGFVERMLSRLPGIKTIYESVRDLMKLFGGDSRQMGRVVQYNVPGADISLLGIMTNENPFGLPPGSPHRKVTIYVPYSYMLGGPTFFASPEHIVEVDMTVEQCMKTAATAMVGAQPILRPRPTLPARPPKRPVEE